MTIFYVLFGVSLLGMVSLFCLKIIEENIDFHFPFKLRKKLDLLTGNFLLKVKQLPFKILIFLKRGGGYALKGIRLFIVKVFRVMTRWGDLINRGINEKRTRRRRRSSDFLKDISKKGGAKREDESEVGEDVQDTDQVH